jgi:hypothetical protein
MARTRRNISIEEKIRQEEAALASIKARYDARTEVLEKLRKKKTEQDNEALLETFDKGDKTLEQVLTFIRS